MRKIKLITATFALSTTVLAAGTLTAPQSHAVSSSEVKSWWNESYASYGKWGKVAFVFATIAVSLEAAGFILGPLRTAINNALGITPLSSQVELTLGSSASF